VSRQSLSRLHRFSRFASHTVAMTHHVLTTDNSHQSRRARVGFCSALAVVLVLALSGGSLIVGGTAASASSKAAAKTSTKKALKKFEKCLKQHGVKSSFPGSGGPPSGAPSGTFPTGGGAPGGFKLGKKFQKAIKACSHLLPAGSQFGGGSGPPTNGSTAFAAFRNCMTLNHVTLAKGSYGAKSSTSAVTPTSSSKYKKAYSACSSLLPKSPTAST
jgi:hypothetical protein